MRDVVKNLRVIFRYAIKMLFEIKCIAALFVLRNITKKLCSRCTQTGAGANTPTSYS